MSRTKLIKNTLWYGVVPRLSGVASLFTIPLTTPYLAKSDYGHWGLICSYVSIFMVLGTLGLHANLTNTYFELGATRFRLIWNRLFFLMLVGSLICSAVCGALVFISFSALNAKCAALIAALSVAPIIAYPTLVIAEHYYIINEQPRPLVARSIAASLTNIFISFVGIRYFNLGFVGWVLGSAASSAMLMSSYIQPIFLNLRIRPQVEVSLRRIKKYLKISLPIVPHSLGHALLASSDRIVLGLLFVTIGDIGIYTNGYQMGSIIAPITGGLAAALSPSIQKMFRSQDYVGMRNLFAFSNIGVQVLVFLTALWMPEIYFLLVKNQSLYAAIPTAIVATYTLSTSMIYTFFAAVIFIQKKTANLLWLVFIPALINIGLNFLLVPFFGYSAAALSTVLAQYSICMLPLLHPYFRSEAILWMRPNTRSILLTPLAGVFSMVAVYYYLAQAGLPVKLLGTAAAGLICINLIAPGILHGQQHALNLVKRIKKQTL